MHRSYFKVWLIKTLTLQKVFFLGPVMDETAILSKKITVKNNSASIELLNKPNT